LRGQKIRCFEPSRSVASLRWRRLQGRPLSQESLYFYFMTVASAAKSRYRPLPYPRYVVQETYGFPRIEVTLDRVVKAESGH
jgi:hypothetical protein